MKIMVIGSGGREHTLCWKLAQSELVESVVAVPGNIGIAQEEKCRCEPIPSDNVEQLLALAVKELPDMIIVGPEAPLVAGLTDHCEKAGLKVFGPTARAAILEGSKVFTKELMAKYDIPSAAFQVFDNFEEAKNHLEGITGSIVVKADGLAAGKGVFVCREKAEALNALKLIMIDKVFGDAGDHVVVEECLEGEEASFIAITDGDTVLPLAGSQDHKAIYDGDQGPNTGGMGAYSPAPVITPEIHKQVMERIMIPTIRAMEQEGRPYKGFLYAGLMIKNGIAKVLEFNARMGDPEAQPLLFRMKSDLVPVLAKALEGKLSEAVIEWEPLSSVCVVMASNGYPGSYEKGKVITGIKSAEEDPQVKVFHAGTSAGENGVVTAGGRVLGVTAKDTHIEQAIKKAYDAVHKINWDHAYFRTDIGKKAIVR